MTRAQRRRPGGFSFLCLLSAALSFLAQAYRYARHGLPLLTSSSLSQVFNHCSLLSLPSPPSPTTPTMPPSYSPCPRPCLKRTSHPSPLAPPPHDEPSTLLAIDPSILSSVVRFPHQAAIAHTLGSAIPYDRTPIVVAPNRCALPERGCPGRTYAPEDPHAASLRRSKRSSLSPVGGRARHPRAAAAGDDHYRQIQDDDPTPRQSPRVDYHPLPPLVPDLSSSESSEESDGVASPPPEVYACEHTLIIAI